MKLTNYRFNQPEARGDNRQQKVELRSVNQRAKEQMEKLNQPGSRVNPTINQSCSGNRILGGRGHLKVVQDSKCHLLTSSSQILDTNPNLVLCSLRLHHRQVGTSHYIL